MEQESLNGWTDGESEEVNLPDQPDVTGKSDESTSDAFPERCLSVTIRGPWGHFRRVEGNVVKQTYRIIPRTTVAGLFAAVLGMGRDEYYDLFSAAQSAVAVEPVEQLRTLNMPMNTLSTSAGDMRSLNARGKISVKLPNPAKLRQQHNYEVLVGPAYRIDVALADRERYEQLREKLAAGKSHYVPSLGLSEHLAEIEYHGEFEIRDGPSGADGGVEIDSAVPDAVDDIIPSADTRCEIEESPAFMAADSGGRTTTGFTTYTYNPDAGPLMVQNVDTSQVDGRTVVFV